MASPFQHDPEKRKKDVHDRVLYITEAFINFRASVYAEEKAANSAFTCSGLNINQAVVYEVATRYFEDLDKERIEHQCGLFNGYRQAAFTLKWWMRLRPIYTSSNIASFLNANEDFALSLALTHLEVDPSDVDPFFFDIFNYSLRYDSIDDGGLLVALGVLLNPKLQALHAVTVKQVENVT